MFMYILLVAEIFFKACIAHMQTYQWNLARNWESALQQLKSKLKHYYIAQLSYDNG